MCGKKPNPAKEQAKAEKKAEADRVAAENAATDASNNLLLGRKRRRQGSALSTGATGGTAMLSSAMAYGKSTLGG